MYFPFLACEAKSGNEELRIADKQNAHSMTMAVRGIVELFKLVSREDELHRKILAFSISYNDRNVRIYGHYALTKNSNTTFYRHPISSFDFTAEDGRDKWTAYQFTKNVYFGFMPKLHTLICSAVDQISLNAALQVALRDSIGSRSLESEELGSQEIALLKENQQYKRQYHQLVGQFGLLKQLVSSNANVGGDSAALKVLQQKWERERQEH